MIRLRTISSLLSVGEEVDCAPVCFFDLLGLVLDFSGGGVGFHLFSARCADNGVPFPEVLSTV